MSASEEYKARELSALRSGEPTPDVCQCQSCVTLRQRITDAGEGCPSDEPRSPALLPVATTPLVRKEFLDAMNAIDEALFATPTLAPIIASVLADVLRPEREFIRDTPNHTDPKWITWRAAYYIRIAMFRAEGV